MMPSVHVFILMITRIFMCSIALLCCRAVVAAVESVPPGSGLGLSASYYNNIDFSGGVVRRVDATVDWTWPAGVGPVAGIEAQTYSVEWTGQLQALTTETYTIVTLADDGVQVFIDGVLAINNASLNYDATVVRRHQATRSFVAGGFYDIRVRYRQNRGTGRIALLWSTPTMAEQVVPQSQLSVIPPEPVAIDPPGTGAGLHARYFDNQDFTGGVVERIDATVDFAWGTAAPHPEIDATYFSVLWQGRLTPRSTETYTISTLADDGVQVFVDGTLMIDQQHRNYDTTVVRRSGVPIACTVGVARTIEVRYNQQRANGTMRLLWSSPNIPEEVIPQSQLSVIPPDPVAFSPVGEGTGLRARYYDRQDFTGGMVERVDATVDFAWGTASPAPDIEPGTFSVIWSGTIRPRTTERYYLTTLADDGVQVRLDGVTVIDQAHLNYDATRVRRASVPVDFVADVERTIELRYYQQRAHAAMRLLWSSPNIPEEVVPRSQLFVIPPPAATLSPPGDGIGLHARYWDNQNFSGGMVERIDPTVDFAWANGQSPAPDIAGSTFAVIWEGRIKARSSERYTITTRTDDGVRVIVDGAMVINDQSLNYDASRIRRNSVQFDWEADSEHAIEIWYYQQRATGTMQLLWSTPTMAETIIPQSQLSVVPPVLAALSPPAGGLGLCSTWWANQDFTGQVDKHIDPVVDHAWGVGVEPKPGMGGSYYAVTWRGVLQARSTERYYLSTLSDDSVRLVIDGETVVDDQRNNYDATAVRRNTVALDWMADSQHTIEIWYAQTRGTGRIALLWSTATIAEQVVPSSQLFPPPSAAATIVWPDPPAIVYGTALSEAQLNATADEPGAFAYSPPVGTVLPAGSHTVSVLFVPSDQTRCASARATIALMVEQAVPAIAWPSPDPIVWGTALDGSQRNATVDIPGTFAYEPPIGTMLEVGTHTLTAVFTPEDTQNYLGVNTQVPLVVLPATPTIIWPLVAAITYGTPLSAIQLHAIASVNGIFVYDPPLGTVLDAGLQILSVTFSPTDAVHYTTVQAVIELTVDQATPVIAWDDPAAIVDGTVLSASQLNASASVPGTFTYTPPLGTVLPVGTHALIVVFAPTDAVNFLSATDTVALVVTANGGGGDENPPPPPVLPTVTVAVSPSSLTGEKTYTNDAGQTVYLSKNDRVSFTVDVTASGWTVVETGVSAGGQNYPATGAALSEGRYDVTGWTKLSWQGQEQTVASTGTVALLVDRTPPTLRWALPGSSDPDGSPLNATMAADSQLLRLNGGDDASNQKVRDTLGLLCWSKSTCMITAEVDDASGAALSTAPDVQVGTTTVMATVTAGATGADPARVTVSGFADVPDAVTVLESSLAMQAQAGEQVLRVRLLDRCGNQLDADQFKLWVKARSSAARMGYLPLDRTGISSAPPGIIRPHGDTDFGGCVLLVTPADVLSVQQLSSAAATTGPVARRLTAGPGTLAGMYSASAVVWELPIALKAQSAGDDYEPDDAVMRGWVRTVDMAGNVSPVQNLVAWQRRFTLPTPRLGSAYSVNGYDLDDAIDISVMYEWWWQYWEEAPDPGSEWNENGWLVYWGSRSRSTDCGFGLIGEQTHGISPLTTVREQPVGSVSSIALQTTNRVGDVLEARVQTNSGMSGRPAYVGAWTVAPEIECRTNFSGEWDDIDGHDLSFFPGEYDEYYQPMHGLGIFAFGGSSNISNWNPVLYWEDLGGWGLYDGEGNYENHSFFGNVFTYYGDVTERFDLGGVDQADCGYVWSPLRYTPGRMADVPASWSDQMNTVQVPNVWGENLVSGADADTEPIVASASADTGVVVPISRDMHGGLLRVQWRDGERQQQFGFEAANILRINQDVQLAGVPARLEIEGYYVDVPFPGGSPLAQPSMDGVRFLAVDLRRMAEAGLSSWGSSTPDGMISNIDLFDAWVDDMVAQGSGVSAQQQIRRAYAIRRSASLVLTDGVLGGLSAWLSNVQASAPNADVFHAYLNQQMITVATNAYGATKSVFDGKELALSEKYAQDGSWDAAAATALLEQAAVCAKARLDIVRSLVLGWRSYRDDSEGRLRLIQERINSFFSSLNDGGAWDRVMSITVTASDFPIALKQGYPGPVNHPQDTNGGGDQSDPLAPRSYAPEWVEFAPGFWDARVAAKAIAEAYYGSDEYRNAYSVWSHAHGAAVPKATWVTSQRQLIVAGFADQLYRSGELPIDTWITVSGVRVEVGDVAAPLRQRLIVDVQIGSEAVGLYDVFVNYGYVHAYPDELSQQYAGANGAHRMKEALKIIKIGATLYEEFEDGTEEPVSVIEPDVSGAPGLSMSVSDAYLESEGYLSASVTGKINDGFSAWVGSGNSITLTLYAGDQVVGTKQVQAGGGASADFDFGTVQLGDYKSGGSLKLVSTNVAGQRAIAEYVIPYSFDIKKAEQTQSVGGAALGAFALKVNKISDTSVSVVKDTGQDQETLAVLTKSGEWYVGQLDGAPFGVSPVETETALFAGGDVLVRMGDVGSTITRVHATLLSDTSIALQLTGLAFIFEGTTGQSFIYTPILGDPEPIWETTGYPVRKYKIKAVGQSADHQLKPELKIDGRDANLKGASNE